MFLSIPADIKGACFLFNQLSSSCDYLIGTYKIPSKNVLASICTLIRMSLMKTNRKKKIGTLACRLALLHGTHIAQHPGQDILAVINFSVGHVFQELFSQANMYMLFSILHFLGTNVCAYKI